MSIFLRFFSLLLILPTFSACSVLMAASGSETPDLSFLRKGVSRALVEEKLDRPIREIRVRGGKVAVYQYFTGDEPNVGRAATYALIDVATVGIAEIFTSPMEMVQGDKHVLEVFYGFDNRVKQIRHRVIEAPIPAPERLIGIESSDKQQI